MNWPLPHLELIFLHESLISTCCSLCLECSVFQISHSSTFSFLPERPSWHPVSRPPFFSYEHIQFILVWQNPSQFIVSDLYVYLFYVFPISLCSTRAVIVFPVRGRMCGTNEKLFEWANEPTGKRGGDGGSQRRQWPAAPLIELAAFPYPRPGMTVLHMCRIQQLWEVQMGWIPVVVLNARGKPLPWMNLCVPATPNIIVLWEKKRQHDIVQGTLASEY